MLLKFGNGHFPIQQNKQRINILIPAYRAEKFIEECLNSIEQQTYFENNNDYEVLIGVDSCDLTLSTLYRIRKNYRNLRIFNMEKNVGTYIVLNTMLSLINSDNIIIFGSDDIMRTELVNEVIQASSSADVVRMCFNAFISDKRDARKILEYAHGAIFFKKKIIEIAGGFQPWKCAADTELIFRILEHSTITSVSKPLFYRRIHNDSVTSCEETGKKSELRKEYSKLIKIYKADENIKIDRVIGNYIEV